ncbi:galectin-1-like [Pyxicephalus adspersus]|uniref:Galectin n=1 Tax=Pyxicephalus adspersus TaxID=30357 RepID=A0AAV3AY97_PYXAD|nr:TPA: hypothetical protein GDO54_000167 [Pyxicephalus adspersus]
MASLDREGGPEGYNVIVSHLNLKPGNCIELTGFVPEVCTDFAVNLGLDAENLLLHFNPRFHLYGCTRKIMCCSVINFVWGEPMIVDAFPFIKGGDNTISIKYEREAFIIMLPTGILITFGVRVPVEVIPLMYFKNFRLKRLRIG